MDQRFEPRIEAPITNRSHFPEAKPLSGTLLAPGPQARFPEKAVQARQRFQVIVAVVLDHDPHAVLRQDPVHVPYAGFETTGSPAARYSAILVGDAAIWEAVGFRKEIPTWD